MFRSLISDVMDLTNSELDDRIRASEIELRRLQAEQVTLIAVAEHRRVYADDEHRSISASLRATLNCSSSEATRRRPGCDLLADWCQVDHQVEWADGGATDQDNSGVECARHNIAKSKRRWRTKRAVNGRNDTIRPDGTIMLPVGARPPTFPADDDPDDHTPAEIAEFQRIARTRLLTLAS